MDFFLVERMKHRYFGEVNNHMRRTQEFAKFTGKNRNNMDVRDGKL